jgi:non-specific serine/threonine protein kinase/serine/threonine-protein kinase
MGPDDKPSTPDLLDVRRGAEYFANILAAVRDGANPTKIGRYFIEQQIGEGGMGSVYKAEQREPIRRTVAIKVIKLGMDTRQVIARFESERQALALMDHPNVARVLDAGATETGRPYFVMEYVEGSPITAFADEQKLTLRQRLELFRQACEAVQHAHQKAIIHRDLKPTNILVTNIDGQPQVKVIDFGVAKAIHQRLTERTMFTEAGQLMGTPEYMSPEQADALELDTRTDVYSLGVVLYELLTGALPFDPSTLRSAGYAEIQRIIRDVEPPRPSTRLSSLGSEAQEVAQRRQAPLEALEKQLKSELEWIPLKAMRKDCDQRYATAAELSEDIANYLANRPLRAGPESRVYRARKFLRRNKAGVAAAAAMVLLLIAGIIATTRQAIRATRAEARALEERDNAQATLNFLTNDVLSGATPDNIPDVKVRDKIIAAMITPAAKRVSENFKDRPLIESSVRTAIQTVLREIGRSDLALPHAEAALSIRRRLLGEDHPDTITSLHNYATVVQQLGRNAEAEPLEREALERYRRVLGDDDLRTLEALNNYAGVLWELGRSAEAEPLFKEALERYRRVEGEDHLDTISAMNNYASALQSLGQTSEALPLFKKALEDSGRVLGDDHPSTIHALNNYAGVMRSENRLAEAESLFKQVVERSRRVFGEEHPETLKFLLNYGSILYAMGRFDDAEPVIRQTMETCRRVLGEFHPYTVDSLSDYAYVLRDLGRYAEAEVVARQTVASAVASPSFGAKHPRTKSFAGIHAKCLDLLARNAEAAAVRHEFALPEPTTRPVTRP